MGVPPEIGQGYAVRLSVGRFTTEDEIDSGGRRDDRVGTKAIILNK